MAGFVWISASVVSRVGMWLGMQIQVAKCQWLTGMRYIPHQLANHSPQTHGFEREIRPLPAISLVSSMDRPIIYQLIVYYWSSVVQKCTAPNNDMFSLINNISTFVRVSTMLPTPDLTWDSSDWYRCPEYTKHARSICMSCFRPLGFY